MEKEVRKGGPEIFKGKDCTIQQTGNLQLTFNLPINLRVFKTDIGYIAMMNYFFVNYLLNNLK